MSESRNTSGYIDDKRLYRTKEAASITQESEKTWEARRLKGVGPKYIKLGRSVRYLGRDLREWIERNRRSSTSEGQGDE